MNYFETLENIEQNYHIGRKDAIKKLQKCALTTFTLHKKKYKLSQEDQIWDLLFEDYNTKEYVLDKYDQTITILEIYGGDETPIVSINFTNDFQNVRNMQIITDDGSIRYERKFAGFDVRYTDRDGNLNLKEEITNSEFIEIVDKYLVLYNVKEEYQKLVNPKN
jgi:hypothetical protein